MKYIIIAGDYLGECPQCIGTLSREIVMFKSIKEVLKWGLDNLNKKEVENESLYSYKTGKKLWKVELNTLYKHHNAIGLEYKFRNKTFKTIDNGHGKLIWSLNGEIYE